MIVIGVSVVFGVGLKLVARWWFGVDLLSGNHEVAGLRLEKNVRRRIASDAVGSTHRRRWPDDTPPSRYILLAAIFRRPVALLHYPALSWL